MDFPGTPNFISQIPEFTGFFTKKNKGKLPGFLALKWGTEISGEGFQNPRDPKLFPVNDYNSSGFLTRKIPSNTHQLKKLTLMPNNSRFKIRTLLIIPKV